MNKDVKFVWLCIDGWRNRNCQYVPPKIKLYKIHKLQYPCIVSCRLGNRNKGAWNLYASQLHPEWKLHSGSWQIMAQVLLSPYMIRKKSIIVNLHQWFGMIVLSIM